MKDEEKTQRFERRKFLSVVVAAGATAAVGAACTKNRDDRSSGAPDIPQQGYQETEHVRRYYETARL